LVIEGEIRGVGGGGGGRRWGGGGGAWGCGGGGYRGGWRTRWYGVDGGARECVRRGDGLAGRSES